MTQNIKNIMKKLKPLNRNLKENLYRKDHKIRLYNFNKSQ